MALIIRPLSPQTWGAQEALMQAHNGVWGGCWCLAFHADHKDHQDPEDRRTAKETRVLSGTTHAALVMDGAACVGWAQFGSPAELPRIKARKAVEGAGDALPDWRITCFFVDRHWRGRGVAGLALSGAVDLIAQAGGGSVEAYPEAIEGQKTSAGFLWSGTLSIFERAGFTPVRPIGKHRWLVRRTVTGNAA